VSCPKCKGVELQPVMTKEGAPVDFCPECKGIWLDRGEIFHFSSRPNELHDQIKKALKNPGPSDLENPITTEPMVHLSLYDGKVVIDYCPKTEGIWLEEGEMSLLNAPKSARLRLDVDRGSREPADADRSSAFPNALPNLGLTSGLTLFFLYALLGIVLITLVNFQVLSAWVALLFLILFACLQFLLSPFLMDFFLRWFYSLTWEPSVDLPAHLGRYLKEISQANGIRRPRVGIIADGSPNAFTYGHTPNNARIVITSGLTDLLTEEEVEAVVAHEVGHAVHWDILVMTAANLIPMVLYYVYRTLLRTGGGGDRSAAAQYAVAIGSYVLYLVSEYVVLWLSRTREYYADRFAADASGDPGLLASALVKIGYGLAGKGQKEKDRRPEMEAVKAMGIFDPTSARALAVTSYHPRSLGGEVDKETLKDAMKWDLWNPWALYYELNSTHPLIAKRLIALSRQAEVRGKEPYIRFQEKKPESYWDEFSLDAVVSVLPLLALLPCFVLFSLSRDFRFLAWALVMLGIAYLVRVTFSYKFSAFPEMSVSALLKKVKVSGIRPIPCTLRGTIIGRGVPGLIWSEDFVFQDETGILFLDYRQPLAIWNFLFGLLRAKHYRGREARIRGWYRRSPVPYVELKTLETADNVTECYVFHVKLVWGVLFTLLGILLLFRL